MVLKDGGVLLEHLAKLATNVVGLPSAVIGVVDRRKGQEPRRATHGLSRGQLSLIKDIELTLDAGPAKTIIPDVTQDPRFGQEIVAAGIRFLVHRKLISPGGELVGSICLIGETPLPGLTPAQDAALDHIAAMVMADRQREQRHLHLMHVADRALRVDRMLRLVSEAESCTDALTNLLEALCHFHGAPVGQISQLIRPDKPLVEISRYQQSHEIAYASGTIDAALAMHDVTAEAIRRNKSRAIRLSHLEGPEGSEEALGAGFTGHVCIPIQVHHQRFGISLTFNNETSDLDEVAADIESLGDTIRPALFQKVIEERIRFAANHDDLTQLANRLMFQNQFRAAIANAHATGRRFALLCLDLDGFKLINDTHGHGFGDSLLVCVAQRLRDGVRETDTVARMGGDEFAIIQPLDNDSDEAISLAQRLLTTVTEPYDLAGRRAGVGVSIGMALYPEHGESPDLLLRNADKALYRAKKAGRKTWRMYDPIHADAEEDPPLVEQDLRDAMARGDFSLAFQPVCDGKSMHVAGFEALLRWRHPLLGQIEPDFFIPLAEKTGLIVPLGQWVLETACAEAAKWDHPAFLSVNLSPLQFRQTDLPRQVAEVLRRTGLSPSRLRLEVTEGVLLDDSDLILRTMQGLQRQNIRMMLDDFGTAYASMSYLRRFPFDGIKIDKSFVRSLCDDAITLAIVQAIQSLADRLDLIVVAEGVETERELNVLRQLGCRFVQGFLTGRPMDSHQARAILRQSWSGAAERDLKSLMPLPRIPTDVPEPVGSDYELAVARMS